MKLASDELVCIKHKRRIISIKDTSGKDACVNL